MCLLIEQVNRIENKIKKIIVNMNKDLSQITVQNDIPEANYPILFKGIWTGILISLIVHQFLTL